ncbi:penicillin-binding protein 2, partial [Burkholderia stagnalis]
MSVKNKTHPADPYAAATKHPMLASRLPMWRSKLIVIIVFLAFAALIARAFWVQVANQDFYVGQGQKRYQRTIELDAMRGSIVDRNGAMLAVSLSTYEIWANPKQVAEADYPQISKLLDMPLAEVKRRLG